MLILVTFKVIPLLLCYTKDFFGYRQTCNLYIKLSLIIKNFVNKIVKQNFYLVKYNLPVLLYKFTRRLLNPCTSQYLALC